MDKEEKLFVAYVATWVADRIITVLQENAYPLLSYPDLLDQADIIVEEFDLKSLAAEGE